MEEWADAPAQAARPARAPIALAPTATALAAEPEESTQPSHRGHPLRRLLLGALAAGVLIAIVVFGRHTLGQSLHVLGSADLGWLGLALAVEVVSLTAFGLSRRYLLRANGHLVSFRSVMAVTYASNALSSSVPFAGTELAVVYAYRQFRRHGADAPTTSWALAVSAIFSTSALSFVLVTGAVAAGQATAVFGFAGAAIYLIPGAAVLLALRYTRVRNVLHTVLAYLAGVSRRLFGKPENGAEGLDHFLDEVSSTHLPRRQYAEVFGLAVANWLFDCAALALAIRAMGEPIPWHDLLLVYGAGAAVGSTGITPGGFGVVELTLTAALAAGDMPEPKALAAVLAYRLVNFWLVLACGWVAMGALAKAGRRRNLAGVRCPQRLSRPPERPATS